MIFTESQACRTQRHCRTCRDPRASKWRQSLFRGFEFSDTNVNFECPHGKPWQGRPPEAMVSVSKAAKTSGTPTWEVLKEMYAKQFPEGLPELEMLMNDRSCPGCRDEARRRRFLERLQSVKGSI